MHLLWLTLYYSFQKNYIFLLQQLANPRNDDWSRFVHTLQELENNKADQELDTLNNLSSGNSYLMPIR